MNHLTSTVMGLVNKKNGKSSHKASTCSGRKRTDEPIHCLKENEKILVKEALASIEKNGVISGQELINRIDKRR